MKKVPPPLQLLPGPPSKAKLCINYCIVILKQKKFYVCLFGENYKLIKFQQLKKNSIENRFSKQFQIIQIIFSKHKNNVVAKLAVVYTGFRGWGGGPGSNGGGYVFTLEKSKIQRFFKLERFHKLKNNEIYILKILKENLRFLKKLLKFYRNLRKKFRENFRKFAFQGFRGGAPKIAKLLKTQQKNQWKPANF